MANIVTLGYEYFPDPTQGRPVSNGSIYIGVPDGDPANVPSDRKSVSIIQEDGVSVPVSQPINTGAGGVPLYNGSPVLIQTTGNYSLAVLNNQGSQVYYTPNQSLSLKKGGVLDITEWADVGNGEDDYNSFQSAINYLKSVGGGTLYVPNGEYLLSGTLILDEEPISIKGDGVIKDNFSVTGGEFVHAVGSILKATSASPIMKITTQVGATVKTTGCTLEGIGFNGGDIATECLVLENTDRNLVKMCTFEDATVDQVLMIAMNITMPNTSAKDVQNNHFDSVLINAPESTTGLHLDSESVSSGNASMNKFDNVYVRHANGIGIYLENADSNTFDMTRCTRLISQTGDALVFGEGIGATNNKYARTNHFYNFHSSQGRVYAQGTGTDFPSIDNIVYLNLDGASATLEIARDTNATLTCVTARQSDITSQNHVAVINSNPSNFHNTPFTAGTALAYFKGVGFFPYNCYGGGGKLIQFYDAPNDALYKCTASATGWTWAPPPSIANPKFTLSGWVVNAASYEVGGTKVLGAQSTGWGDPTGISNKTGFDTATVTLEELAEHVKAMTLANKAHGFYGD